MANTSHATPDSGFRGELRHRHVIRVAVLRVITDWTSPGSAQAVGCARDEPHADGLG